MLISAISGLIAIFAKSQSGMEFFRKTGAALDVTFGLLVDSVEELGNFLIAAFTQPQQALQDLGDTIRDGIVYYFSEFYSKCYSKKLLMVWGYLVRLLH